MEIAAKPLVSVVIPVYNQTQALLRAVQSVLNQSYGEFEILVVDDGSDIEIEPELQLLNDGRIFFYRNPVHQNANVARNLGVEKARGEYVAMLDSDDEWLDNHLEECLALLHEKGADGVYGSVVVKSSARFQTVIARKKKDGEKIINYLLTNGYGAQTSTLFITTESARKIGWDPTLGRHQDYDFVVRFMDKFCFVVKENPTVIYHLSVKNYRIDYDSCMRFIKRNKRDIRSDLYNRYHKSMYEMVIKTGGEKRIIEHYRREAIRYKCFCSYQEYADQIKPLTVLAKWRCKLSYLCNVLFWS